MIPEVSDSRKEWRGKLSRPFNYGGQAVLEGVMMRGSKAVAVAVRDPQGRIVIHSEPLNKHVYGGPISRWPFLRGLTMLWDSLVLGMRSLMFSADVATGGAGIAAPTAPIVAGPILGAGEATGDSVTGTPDPAKPSAFEGPVMWGMMLVSLAFGIGVFFLTPKLLAQLAQNWTGSIVWSLVAEGVVRLGLFVGYIWLIGFMPDIRRVFAYHGAEHKTINAYEASAPLTVDGVRPFTTAHPRCGTAFLLTVVVLSILVFAPLAKLPLAWGLIARVLLIPLIAMLGYEFIRFSARHLDHPLMRAIIAPNLALQSLTTRPPDDDMLQVAIAALNRVLEIEGSLATD
jgi:uncharacterized protein YqhQ